MTTASLDPVEQAWGAKAIRAAFPALVHGVNLHSKTELIGLDACPRHNGRCLWLRTLPQL
jgi:hypothetical protein